MTGAIRNTLKNFRNAKWFYRHLYAYEVLWRRNRALKRNEPVLFNVELFFDTRCNFQCEHCSISQFQSQGMAHMSLEQIERIADEASKMHTLICCLVGGEPTLNRNLCDIIGIFHRRKILPTMISNGALLTRDYVKDLKKAGIFNIGISLNGARPETHDSFVRKEGAFQKALDAIEVIKGEGINCSICVVPTRDSLQSGDFDQLIRIACKKALRVNVNYPALCGRYTGEYDQLLTDEEIGKARQYFELPNVTSDFTVMGGKYECPAGRKRIYILPDGQVTPCTFIHISFGNILSEPLGDIMSRIWSTKVFMSRPGCCVVSESRQFIKEYLEPVFKAGKVPLYYTEHPSIGIENASGKGEDGNVTTMDGVEGQLK